MKKILIIGIGAGDPGYVTMQAVEALNQTDVFFIMDKGPSKAKLIELRKEICRRYIRGNDHRFVDATSPEWARDTEDYFSTVDDLNRDKQALFERLISEEMADGECGAFLVWGDPTLYDSTIRIVEMIASGGRHQLEYDVIPGISSVQALAAKHKTTLNRIGQRGVWARHGERYLEIRLERFSRLAVRILTQQGRGFAPVQPCRRPASVPAQSVRRNGGQPDRQEPAVWVFRVRGFESETGRRRAHHHAGAQRAPAAG